MVYDWIKIYIKAQKLFDIDCIGLGFKIFDIGSHVLHDIGLL